MKLAPNGWEQARKRTCEIKPFDKPARVPYNWNNRRRAMAVDMLGQGLCMVGCGYQHDSDSKISMLLAAYLLLCKYVVYNGT